MAVVDSINIYTQALNAAFTNAYEMIAEPAPIEQAMTLVPSGGRIENYPWVYPPPLMRQWSGYRRYAKPGAINYRVPNVTYTSEFEILKEDFDDEQVAGWSKMAAALADGAKEWRGIQTLLNLANGQTVKCFDDSYFFASSHNIGTGNNIVTGTASSSDGITHAMVCLVVKNKLVKPLLWQTREEAKFNTDVGSQEAMKNRTYKWWTDLRGAAAFGFWYDAVLVKFPNTPTVTDMQTTLGSVNAAFRTFTYPKNLPDDANQYPHGQTEFNAKTMVLVASSKIDHIVRQALTLSLISTTENPWLGWAKQITSGYLDGIV